MMIRSLFFVATVLGLSVTAIMHDANAALPDQPCFELGKTTISDDQQNMVACLNNGDHNLVWKGLVHPLPAVAAVPLLDANPVSRSNTPSAPLGRWQGWYAGGNVGVTNTINAYSLDATYAPDIRTYGGTAGLVGGYNRVRGDGLFYGGEADINYMSNSKRLMPTPGSTSFVSSAWDGYASARGRIGIAFDPALVFLTAGLALVDVSHKYEATFYNGSQYIPTGFSSSTLHVGSTVGAGAEFALTDRVSMSAQYLRLEMPETTKIATLTDGLAVTNYKYLLDDSANIFRVGLNWHFE